VKKLVPYLADIFLFAFGFFAGLWTGGRIAYWVILRIFSESKDFDITGHAVFMYAILIGLCVGAVTGIVMAMISNGEDLPSKEWPVHRYVVAFALSAAIILLPDVFGLLF